MTDSEIIGWWTTTPQERYWIESTDRNDLGLNLLAPISTNAGQRLVSSVKNGDIILHYFQPSQSIVAFSTALGKPKSATIKWPDRINSPERLGHTIDLTGYTELEEPIHLSEIRLVESSIREIYETLLETFRNPIYFPYQFRTENPMRPAQGAYLSKFPKDLISLFPSLVQELEPKTLASVPLMRLTPAGKKLHKNPSEKGRSNGIGRIKDEAKKKAIEIHAMQLAFSFLQEQGYVTQDVSNFRNIGYDIEATKQGESVGVEVKGSSILDKFSVDLSKNEVDFALAVKNQLIDKRSLLLVIDGIELSQENEKWYASGGSVKTHWDWYPLEDSLIPTSFRYILPIN